MAQSYLSLNFGRVHIRRRKRVFASVITQRNSEDNGFYILGTRGIISVSRTSMFEMNSK